MPELGVKWKDNRPIALIGRSYCTEGVRGDTMVTLEWEIPITNIKVIEKKLMPLVWSVDIRNRRGY
jgi:hypothetical protein